MLTYATASDAINSLLSSNCLIALATSKSGDALLLASLPPPNIISLTNCIELSICAIAVASDVTARANVLAYSLAAIVASL